MPRIPVYDVADITEAQIAKSERDSKRTEMCEALGLDPAGRYPLCHLPANHPAVIAYKSVAIAYDRLVHEIAAKAERNAVYED